MCVGEKARELLCVFVCQVNRSTIRLNKVYDFYCALFYCNGCCVCGNNTSLVASAVCLFISKMLLQQKQHETTSIRHARLSSIYEYCCSYIHGVVQRDCTKDPPLSAYSGGSLM